MGSSKKHKEKDKDRERRRKHKDRDKDRDRERKHRSKHRHKHDKDRHAEKEVEAGEVSSPEQSQSQKHERKRRRSPSPPQIKVEKDVVFQGTERGDGADEGAGGGGSGAGGGFSASLSITETNKIRAKLGLAPLEVNDGGGGGEPGEIVEEKKDVHKPAVNMAEVKKNEALREKMALIREKRLINKKLHKVKILADDDDDDDDAAAWVEKMRKKQIAKAEAARRAKMLEEMDEEFGIGKIVEDEFSKTKEKDAYSGRHLGGFKVEHSMKHFNEGQSVILTLKDMDALKEEEDVLVNVNMIDNERAAKNVELKKKRPDYKAYQEDDFDEEGTFRPKALLGKYDEEIEGEQKKSFRLNTGGSASLEDDDYMDRIRNQLRQQAVSLDLKAPTVASEYYTVTEMESFKKPKKKRRKLKAKSIIDELLPEADTGRDHGARGGLRRRTREADESEDSSARNGQLPAQQEAMDMDVAFPDADQAPIEFGQARDDDDDIWGQVIEDEAEKELHNVLNKARKLKQKSKSAQRVEDQVANVVANIKQEPEEEEETAASSSKASNIIFNSTSEFCRTLGDIPSYGKSGLRDEEEENLLDFEKEEEDDAMEEEEGDEAGGAWNAVSMEDKQEVKKQEEDLGPVLDDEPTLQGGIAGALSLATKKGYLVKEEEKVDKSKSLTITAKHFMVEDKNFNDIDAKYNKHDRYRGPLMDFKEKSGYRPDVNITYTDDTGRSLNQKEAFRVLSHRFHGKGSGKMKTEKRAKKLLEEEAMKKMSSTDTPLNTVARMQEKQKNLQSAYIVLSGGSKTMTA